MLATLMEIWLVFWFRLDDEFPSYIWMNNICLIQESYNKCSNTEKYKNSPSFLSKLRIVNRLKGHNGCVNSLAWNENGSLLISGSDDKCIGITNYSNKDTNLFSSGHSSNIFCARFLPYTNDHQVVSCAGDGNIILNNLEVNFNSDHKYSNELLNPTTSYNKYNCHVGAVYKVLPFNLGHGCFISCGEDGTIRLFDTRIKESCFQSDCLENVIIRGQQGISCIAVDPLFPVHIMGGFVDSSVRMFDYRMLASSPNTYEKSLNAMYGFFKPQNMKEEFRRITSLAFDPSTEDLLVSYSGSNIYLINQQQNIASSDQENVDDLYLNQNLNAIFNTKKSHQKPMSFISPNFQVRLRDDWSDTGPSAASNLLNPTNSGTISSHLLNESDDAEGRRTRFRSILLNQITNMFNQMLNSRLSHHRPNYHSAAILPLCLDGCESPTWSQVVNVDVNIVQSKSEAPRDYQSSSADWFKTTCGVIHVGVQPADDIPTSSRDVLPGTSNNATGTISEKLETPNLHCGPNARSSNRDSMSGNESIFHRERCEYNSFKINCQTYRTKQIFSGHRNARTMIKEANFWGGKYVMSGSDCGHVFFWERTTGHVVRVIEADRHVVNCVQPHPNFLTLATSGIDYDIKLIEPLEEPQSAPPLDPQAYAEGEMALHLEEKRKLEKLCETNGLMLRQSRDIVTVPASFMIRMLAQMQRSNESQTENTT